MTGFAAERDAVPMRSRLTVVLTSLALVACGGHADRPPRQSTLHAGAASQATSVGSALPSARAGEPEAKVPARAPAVPPMLARRTAPSSGKATPALVQEIASIEALLKPLAKADAKFAVTARRLARVYVELEHAKQAELVALDAELGAARATSAPTADLDRRRAACLALRDRSYERATALYRDVIDAPSYPAVDEALYELAVDHEARARAPEAGANDAGQASAALGRARATYLELVKKCPESRYVGPAFLAFGDLYFDEAVAGRSEWQLAIAGYHRAQREGVPPTNEEWAYASYKLGFAYWHTGERPAAIDAFKAAAASARQHPSQRVAALVLADAERALDEI